MKKNANTKICTLLELADKRERVEHIKKCWHNPTVFEKRELQAWWHIRVSLHTGGWSKRVSLVHPGLPRLPRLAIFIFTTSIQLFPGSLLETITTLIAVTVLRAFLLEWKKGAGWDRVLCSLGCPCTVAEEELEQILLTGMSYHPQLPTVVWNTIAYRKKQGFLESCWSQVHRRKHIQHGGPGCSRRQQGK